MSAEFFLDTNVLLYCFDARVPAKQERALRLVQKALEGGRGVISWQVVQEFLNAALHKSSAGVPAELITDFHQNVLSPLCRIHSQPVFYRQALELHTRTQYRFYDSLILAAAMGSGAKILYSEDLQDGRMFGALTVINPFKES